MAGHSKWANIQHRKKAQDARKAPLHTKIVREITVAARLGGADPHSNAKLRDATARAFQHNVKRDTIDRAIKRGAGGLEGSGLNFIRYEGYGLNGVAIMVECLTDNHRRTVAEIRHVFSKYGGDLGTERSVSYLFDRLGVLGIASGTDEMKIMDIALQFDVQDIINIPDGSLEVRVLPEHFYQLKTALEPIVDTFEQAEITFVAKNEVALQVAAARKLLNMLEAFEDLDDVQCVYSNAAFPASTDDM